MAHHEPKVFPIELAEQLARLQSELDRLEHRGASDSSTPMLTAATRRTLALVLQQLGNLGWYCDPNDPCLFRYRADWALPLVPGSVATKHPSVWPLSA
jgi:hypothetical protein